MTLPAERTRAVLQAREFLTRLANPYIPGGIKRIPRAVRQEALRVLRHYPMGYEVADPHSFDEQAVQEFHARDEWCSRHER
jgi:hypothetical protein